MVAAAALVTVVMGMAAAALVVLAVVVSATALVVVTMLAATAAFLVSTVFLGTILRPVQTGGDGVGPLVAARFHCSNKLLRILSDSLNI